MEMNSSNPFRHRSYYYDTETGLYYLQSRYYDPEVGRFLNADALSYLGADGELHGYNLYTYCGNNPVMHIDPTGHFLISTAVAVGFWIGLRVGSIIGAAVGSAVGYDVGMVWGTAPIAGSNGAKSVFFMYEIWALLRMGVEHITHYL